MKEIALVLAMGTTILACTAGPVPYTPVPTLGLNPTETVMPQAARTSIPEPQPTTVPTATSFPEPEGCQRPPDDLARVQVNGQTLNARTLAMLSHAAELYAGAIDIENLAITQGSYTYGEPLSFGTHAGGGAVDLSVVARTHYEILWDEIGPLIAALRTAGFAAWLREPGELGPLSPVHIHAIAIGDAELSLAAQDQLTGPFGYFRGYEGLPQEDGNPHEDRYGGPVVCAWMLELGYAVLREK